MAHGARGPNLEAVTAHQRSMGGRAEKGEANDAAGAGEVRRAH